MEVGWFGVDLGWLGVAWGAYTCVGTTCGRCVWVLRAGAVGGYYVLLQLESIDPMIRRRGSDHTGDVVVRRAVLLFS